MKKLAISIASFVILLVATSAFVDKRGEAVLGEKAPSLILKNSADSAMSLESLEGNWVVLSFWSSADAPSRMVCNRIASYISHLEPGKTGVVPQVVSVNVDRSERLMNEIIRIDGLDVFDENLQFHIEDAGVQRALRQAYSMNEGLRTFIIDPKGKLVAADPTVEDLRRIFG